MQQLKPRINLKKDKEQKVKKGKGNSVGDKVIL